MFIYIFALYISKISNSISAFLHINLNHHQIIENNQIKRMNPKSIKKNLKKLNKKNHQKLIKENLHNFKNLRKL